MDEDSSAKFIGSLTKFLQSLCNGYVEFSRGVELVGHIYLNIDTGEKVDYVLHERVSKNDENSVSFTSNSFHAQPQDKKKTKEASRPDPKGSNRKVNSDDDDDIVIVDHSHSQGAVGSTNTGSVLARGMKRVGSPGFDHRHAQRPRPSPHNTSSHSYTSVNRQQSGRPSATVTSQGASHNENLNISDVKLEQISRDELLSIATHVGEGSGPPHSQTSSSSSVSRSQAQHSGMPGSTIRVGGTGDAAMWVKQEVPDDGDADNNTGWSQERDDSNSNSGSNLYPVMLHQNPAFPGSSVPGFSGHGGPSGANPFPMPGTSQDMSGLDPSEVVILDKPQMAGGGTPRGGVSGHRSTTKPPNKWAESSRRYREKLKARGAEHYQRYQQQARDRMKRLRDRRDYFGNEIPPSVETKSAENAQQALSDDQDADAQQ